MTERICAIEGCSKTTKGRGWCGMHYSRWVRHGDVNYTPDLMRSGGYCGASGCLTPSAIKGYCMPHYKRWSCGKDPQPPTTDDRFWAKVDTVTSSGCWQWTAGRSANGYGKFNHDGHRLAHRWSFSRFVGPIPHGLDLDHLCRNRACCNPAHLEPVTRKENARRGLWGVLKTHCVRGHAFTPENTRFNVKKNSRECRACARERWREMHPGTKTRK